MAGGLRIGEPPIEVHLRHNTRSRRMVLRIGRSGRAPTPTLTLPPGVPAAHVRAFLQDHEDWLRRQLDRLAVRVQIVDGTVLPFGDGELTVAAIGRGRLHLAGGVLHVPGAAAQVPVRARAYIAEAARAACAEGSVRHAARIGRVPGRISLRDPRARWGSCSAQGDLMYSWRLALAPAAVLDYVVAHEVAHLAEMNHSAAFWAVVRGLCPDYPRHRDWLRRHGAGLHAWDFSPVAAEA
jgi:predicted metal-dependent hydrolase